YAFRPGTVFISRPDEPHRMQSYPKGLSTCYLLFRLPRSNAHFLNLPPREARWLRDALLRAPERLFDATDRIRTCFRQLFAIHDSLPRGTPERTLRLRQAVTDLLVEVALAARTPPRPETHLRIKQLVDEIRRRPEAAYPIDELAARVALAPSVLAVRFKRITGLPPHAFVIACRIEQAKRELAGGSRTVADIALRLGFPSPQHFATLFRKATGHAPLVWRRQKQDGG
ncbi:MAG: helix-turn-helix transcriptional regulator, partial [Kiritimatiellae bacterium]|nr:helix-turn-helix transcriptional regulator [Kiritimatiellia bacterium]